MASDGRWLLKVVAKVAMRSGGFGGFPDSASSPRSQVAWQWVGRPGRGRVDDMQHAVDHRRYSATMPFRSQRIGTDVDGLDIFNVFNGNGVQLFNNP